MFQAYHGETSGQHQANFNSLSAQGYRMQANAVRADLGNTINRLLDTPLLP
jgi:hypothetical protein